MNLNIAANGTVLKFTSREKLKDLSLREQIDMFCKTLKFNLANDDSREYSLKLSFSPKSKIRLIDIR